MKGKAGRIIIGLAITFCVVMLIWFGGWAVWDQFHLWDTMQNVEYENTLFVVIALSFVMGIGLSLKKGKVGIQAPEIEHHMTVQNPVQDPLELGSVNKRLDDMADKVADIHSMMKFLKNVKEKKGEKA